MCEQEREFERWRCNAQHPFKLCLWYCYFAWLVACEFWDSGCEVLSPVIFEQGL